MTGGDVAMPGTDARRRLEVSDVEFAAVDGHPLLARIYQPGGDGPFPVVLDVHGGIWTSGSRLTNEAIARAVASSGVVVVSIDFRQPPIATYPASVCDISTAVQWTREHATLFNGDGGTVGALGTSTGGHQALLVGMRPDDWHPADPVDRPGSAARALDFLVLCWPIVDPWARYEWARDEGLTKFVERHNLYWPTTDDMKHANPQRILDRAEPVRTPPTLIIQGTADRNIPFDIVSRFAASYRAAGGTVSVELFEGEPHGFIKRDIDGAAAALAINLINSFVHQQTIAATATRTGMERHT